MPHLPAIFLPWCVFAALAFTAYRLKLYSSKDIVGQYSYAFGAALLLLASGWETVKSLSDYQSWFVVTAYPVIDLAQFLVGMAGLALTVVGLSLYADWQETRHEDVVLRESKLSILENLQHDAREQYQLLDLMLLTIREMLTPFAGCSGAVFLVNRSRRQLILGASVGLKKEEVAALEYYPLDRSLISQAIDLGESMLTARFDFVDRQGRTSRSRFESTLILPLIVGLDRMGAVVLFSGAPKRFGTLEVRYLSPAAEWLAEKLRSARLARELTLAKGDIERLSSEQNSLLARLQSGFKSLGAVDPIMQFCRGLEGLFACSSAYICGLSRGAFQCYGGSEPNPEFSESFKTAVLEAVERRKTLVINQEAVDEQGRARIVRSTLLIPLPGTDSKDMLLLRREGAPFALSTDDLETVALYAQLARSVVSQREISRRDLASRIGFDKIVALLRSGESMVRFDEDPGQFLHLLSDILPESSLAVSFVKNSDGSLLPKSAFRATIEDPAELTVHPGEGPIGEAAATGKARFVAGRKLVEASLESYESTVHNSLQSMFEERGTPVFSAACPFAEADQVCGVAAIYIFDLPSSEWPEWEKLLTLATGLFSFRLTIDALQRRQREISADMIKSSVSAPVINELNNHLAAIVGTAELASRRADLSGDLLLQLRSIMQEAQKAADLARHSISGNSVGSAEEDALSEVAPLVNDTIEMVLADSLISGDLYMAGGRAREIGCHLGKIPAVYFPDDAVKQLFESALSRFAAYAVDDDVISIATYQVDEYVYLDISRHRKNFPPVERVAGFGSYRLADEMLRARPSDVFLKPVLEGGCMYAVDDSASAPAYLSFKFPIKRGTSAQGKPSGISPVRVLAVDDQPIILDLISAMCHSLGYQVVTAISGEEGVQQAMQGNFDVILTDLAMPDISGLEVARRVRKLHPEVPIVLVTGWEASLDAGQLESAGISEVLYKPFRIEQLTDLVRNAALRHSRPL
jgi:CheY-like chemotaxis protein